MHSILSAAPGAPTQDGPRSWRSMALAALGGPVALGAIVGLEVGPVAALLKSLALPAVLAGVAAVMVPALYISAAITGVAPPARDMLRSMAPSPGWRRPRATCCARWRADSAPAGW